MKEMNCKMQILFGRLKIVITLAQKMIYNNNDPYDIFVLIRLSDTISYKTYIVIEIVLILFKIYSTNKSSIIQISFFVDLQMKNIQQQ